MDNTLSALVIHDIKNALSLLEFDLEQMQRLPSPPVGAEQAYRRCVELKSRLINFLTLYKHDQHGLQANRRELDLQDFLADLINASPSVSLGQQRGISSELDVERITIDPHLKLRGIAKLDEYLLELALESALNNANRYALNKVTIWFEQNVGSVSFHVLDDGLGLQSDILGKPVSTGLGMALCLAVASSHGIGTATLVNAEHQGALFTLMLETSSNGV